MTLRPSSPSAVFPGFEQAQRIHVGLETQVYRAIRSADGLPVVLKTWIATHPTPAQLQSMEREYQIHRSVVDASHVIRAFDLLVTTHRYLLVLEDTGGLSVSQFLGGTRPQLRQALGFAIDTLRGLDELHRHQIIHKDLNPSNLILDPVSGRLKVADLSLATRLSQEIGEIRAPELLEGTLPYISPEQTGRMNRPIDHRSDFYSFGVVLYEWLTGSLPFEAVDSLEWVHHHIARAPKPPHELSEIPIALSAITLKLMSKSAEDRYQGVAGILHDLQLVLARLSDRGTWSGELGPSFMPGTRDVQEQFRLPSRFYARAAELSVLTRAFDAACDGQRAVCVISGSAGIGKTALVNELIRPLTQRRGFFLKGKFDQYEHQEAYSAVLAALRQWLMVVLARDPVELQHWRTRLERALGERGALLTELLPELGRLLGPSAPPEPATGETVRLRVQLALGRLLRVIAQPDHPLILVLDDVQWADPASLDLLEVMLLDAEPRAMLLLLAFRDTGPSDVRVRLEHLRDRVQIETLSLGPLSQSDIERWLSETVPSTVRPMVPLARWVHTKTEGNPFFVREFLKSLHAGGHLRFDRARQSWDWELEAIELVASTDNVVELLLSKLQQLPAATRDLLPLTACLGHRFDLETLGLSCRRTMPELARALWPAIVAGLVQPVGSTGGWERFGDRAVPSLPDADPAGASSMIAQFVHDRVQQAAYSLIPELERPALHHRVGTALSRQLTAAERERQLFSIARHLWLGRHLLASGPARLDAAGVHAAAGRKAQASTAFADAVLHFRHAMELLPADRWIETPELATTISLGAIACGYAAGDGEGVLALADETLPHLVPGPARQQVYCIALHTLSAARRHAEAIAVATSALRELGVELPRTVSRGRLGWELLTAWVATRRILSRGKLPEMTDPAALAQNETLTAILPSCYMYAPDIAVLVMCRQVTLMSRAGAGPFRDACFAYAGALLAGLMGDVDPALRLADLLSEAPGTVHARNRCTYNSTVFLDYWRQPVLTLLERLLRIHRESVEAGDLLYAAFALVTYGTHILFWGDDLWRQSQVLELFATFRDRFPGVGELDYVEFYEQELRGRVRILLQVPDDRAACLDPAWVEVPYAALAIHPADDTSRLAALAHRAYLHVLFGHAEAALVVLDEVAADTEAAVGFYGLSLALYVLRPLAALGAWETFAPRERRRRMRMVRHALRTVRRLTSRARGDARELFLAEWHLIEAERLRVIGRPRDAMFHYGRSIDGARRRRAHGILGMACERAAACCRAEGQLDLETHFVREAAYSYERWGAVTKVAQLEELHPERIASAVVPTGRMPHTRSSQMPGDHLDPISAVRTSQALSGELALEPLLAKLMRAVCENAGAQRGFLFLLDASGPDAALRVAASHTIVGPPPGTVRSQDAPFSLARFVQRTGQSMVIDDVRSDANPLLADLYFQHHPSRAVLVVPIERQESRLGVLYLEHTESPGAFTERHREFLKLLVGQIAISITNARLYADLQQARLAEQITRRNAEAANEAKSFFLAKMSHELRTPINAILGYTEIVREDLAAASIALVDDDLVRIQLAGRGLSQLISNILDLTKIECGHVQVHVEPFSPEKLFEEIRADLAPEFRVSTNRLLVETSALAPEVVTDRQKLRQVLLNLLVNANKYTHAGSVTLRGATEADQMRIDVIDDGLGIDPEQHESVFRAFTQVDNSYTRKFDGAGLGLSICRELCAALGGTLTLESVRGRGSRFVVRIPLVFRAFAKTLLNVGHDSGDPPSATEVDRRP